MNIPNYEDYACMNYENNISGHDDFQLGDVVIREIDELGDTTNEIGVIIQVHSPDEFRTDMFGNTYTDDIRLATQFEIDTYRPNILSEGTLKLKL